MSRTPQLRIVGSGSDTRIRAVGDWEGALLDGLCHSARVARAVEKLQREVVARARASGRSWKEIGDSLGISRQSAWERFS